MNLHNPELVSALLDGELHGLRRWRFQRHLRRCSRCQAEYRHIQQVRRLLAANPPQGRLADSPEVFWAQVKRQIQARGPVTVAVSEPELSFGDWLRGHATVLASAAAAVLVVLAGIGIYRLQSRSPGVMANAPASPVVVRVDTRLPDTAATTIAGQDKDVTVIWVSGLPWTADMTELKTLYAQLDT